MSAEFFSKEERNQNHLDGCCHILRKLYLYKYSNEQEKYRIAREVVRIYRSLIGRDITLERALEEQIAIEPLCLAPYIRFKQVKHQVLVSD